MTNNVEPSAWLHPTAGWADASYDVIRKHCLNDGPLPIPLYTHPSPTHSSELQTATDGYRSPAPTELMMGSERPQEAYGEAVEYITEAGWIGKSIPCFRAADLMVDFHNWKISRAPAAQMVVSEGAPQATGNEPSCPACSYPLTPLGSGRYACDNGCEMAFKAEDLKDEPEPDETWQAWYYASFDLAREKIRNLFDTAEEPVSDDMQVRILGVLDDFANMYPEIEPEFVASLKGEEPVSYRLLQHGEIVLADDQFLEDDAMSWTTVRGSMDFVGRPYHAPGLKPFRRAVQAPPPVQKGSQP